MRKVCPMRQLRSVFPEIGVVAGILMVTALVLVISGGTAVDEARAADPGVTLAVATGDTLQINTAGRITGLTWVGRDTLAVLTEIPDTLSESGTREVHLVYQDSIGAVIRREDFTGVLDRGLAWDGEFLWGCGDTDEGRSLLYKIEPDTLKVEEAFDTPGAPSERSVLGRPLRLDHRPGLRPDRPLRSRGRGGHPLGGGPGILSLRPRLGRDLHVVDR